jgi:ATP-dependent DNA helicase RecG
MRRKKSAVQETSLYDFLDADTDAEGIDTVGVVEQLLTPDQIYETAESRINLLYEDRRVEREGLKTSIQTLGEYFSMWANTSPHGGLIVVGINNDGEVTGLKSIEPTRLNRFEGAGHGRCPDARYESKRVRVKNSRNEDDFVLLFRVHYHESKLVETCNGRAFYRIGEECIELKTDEEKR